MCIFILQVPDLPCDRMKTTTKDRAQRETTQEETTRATRVKRNQSPSQVWANGRFHRRRKRPPERRPKVRQFCYSTAEYLPLSSEGPRVEVEYEHEMESVPLSKEALANW